MVGFGWFGLFASPCGLVFRAEDRKAVLTSG